MNFIKKMQDLIYTNTDDERDDYVDENYGGPYGDRNEDMDSAAPAGATRTLNEEPASASHEYNSNVSVSSGTSIEMKVIRPEKLDSVTQIADFLTSGNTVLLNLEATNKETARRLLDFLNGVAYAVGGKVKKVANSTFVITPSNVSISGGQASDTAEHEAI